MLRSGFRSAIVALAMAAGCLAAGAQGIVDERQCPSPPDGSAGGSIDPFTYRSWTDASDNGKYFRRCIQNMAKKPIWTHWKGMLGATWIDPNHRLYGSTFVSKADVAPGGTELYWGDARSERMEPQARCYRGEDACKSKQAAALDPGHGGRVAILPVAFDATPQIRLSAESKQDFVVSTYQEFYLPQAPTVPPKGLRKLALLAESRLSQGSVEYRISAFVSRSYQWDGAGVAFRLRSSDPAAMTAFLLEAIAPTFEAIRGAPAGQQWVLEVTPRIRPDTLRARTILFEVMSADGTVIATLPMSALLP